MPFDVQSESAEIRAKTFLDTLERIPEYGKEVKSFVVQLGTIFRSWQNDERLSEPEVTYFSVDSAVLSAKVKNVLDAAVQWSVLQPKKDMKPKEPSAPLLDVYALNHILAPYFGISYRLRGRIRQISQNDIEVLMFGTEDEKKMLFRDFVNNHQL